MEVVGKEESVMVKGWKKGSNELQKGVDRCEGGKGVKGQRPMGAKGSNVGNEGNRRKGDNEGTRGT